MRVTGRRGFFQAPFSSSPQNNGAPPAPKPFKLNEDVMARLKAAEEEAARLRGELAAAQAGKEVVELDAIVDKPVRFDGQTNRETLAFKEGGAKRSSWLTEADVAFFTGGAPGEADEPQPATPEEASGTVTKRLLFGVIASAALGVFSLVPSSQMQSRPSKPLYLYLIPLLRIQGILEGIGGIINDAEWERLRYVLSRVTGAPNDARENIDAIIALQTDDKLQRKIEAAGLDFVGFIKQCDYNNYFDAIPVRSLSSAQNLQFVDYSSRALVAAQAKLKELLALVPPADLQMARNAMPALQSGFE